ncbi:AmmeMemoRadiSam system protein B [Melioribacteraceae bacterium 4301-Me]|uniref:AmmeMemoRadiSam system protein B n=1 Tax=Pyranulibacter aquaticus TaxID=3163344 RepID=UPI0035952AB7
MKRIREPAVAGMFYPSSPQKLLDEVKTLFDLTRSETNIDNILGIVSPHAGYVYSGKIAASAFNILLNKNYHTVIIISPSHREYFPGISIYDGDAYKTPLGIVPVNKEVRQKLIDSGQFIFEGVQGHRAEHAVEVQLPFLQVILKDFEIVPIVMGDQSRQYVDELSKSIASSLDEKTLIVASSDLSHFYSKETANMLDSIVENHINKFDFDGLQKDLESGKCEACGGGAIVAMMKAAYIASKKNSKVLARGDSGDVTGDFSEVVGYLSAAVY